MGVTRHIPFPLWGVYTSIYTQGVVVFFLLQGHHCAQHPRTLPVTVSLRSVNERRAQCSNGDDINGEVSIFGQTDD